MYTIEKYILDTISLTNSLVIKIPEIATAINKGLVLKYNLKIEPDKKTWKYYMNLAGIKHPTNSKVLIKLKETNGLTELTKEVLDTYRYTRDELKLYGEYYNELITSYPDDTDYIKGCITPVDIDKAIQAKPGVLLTYSDIYVEHQELSIITELNARLKDMINRWHVNEFTITDKLYLPALIGVMYSIIPSMIMNIRLKKVHTNEVHSFHLEHFFRSRYDLWNDVQVLNDWSKMWLYNNLNYIRGTQGRNDTLKTILENVFAKNDVGVGTYELVNSLPISKDNKDTTKSSIVKSDNYFKIKDLNGKYKLNNKQNIGTDTLVTSELFGDSEIDLSILRSSEDNIVRNVKKTISQLNVTSQPTKVLDIDTSKLYKMYGNDIYSSIMDQWLYLATNNTYNVQVDYEDPNTKKRYNLTALDGVYLYYYLLTRLSGNEDQGVNYISYTKSISKNLMLKDITNNMFSLKLFNPVAHELFKSLPKNYKFIRNVDSFNNVINGYITYYKKSWILDVNLNNSVISSNIKLFNKRILEHGKHNISTDPKGISMKNLLLSRGIDIGDNVGRYNYVKSIERLFKVFTGTDIDKYVKLDNDLKSLTSILNKLTSYSTQVIRSTNDNSEISLHSDSNKAIFTGKGLITVTDGVVKDVLESIEGLISVYSDDFTGEPRTHVIRAPGSLKIDKGPEAVIGSQPPEQLEDVFDLLRPVLNVSISEKYVPQYRP